MQSHHQPGPIVLLLLFVGLLLTTCRDPQLAHQPRAPTAVSAPPSTTIVSPDTPTHAPARVSNDAPTREPTYLPKFTLVCPSIPSYPGATRVEMRQTDGDQVRISTYQTSSSVAEVQAWFYQHLAAAGWRDNGVSAYYGATYLNRQADEYNPSISLAIRFVTDEPPTVVYVMRLLIAHPHREAHWCPDLVP